MPGRGLAGRGCARSAGRRPAARPGCTSYPPGTCITFECGGSHQSCGHGAGGFDCFCDVDATRACVCRNDAYCSDLATCNPGNGNGDCAAGYFCIPTSCCGIAQVHAPVGAPPPRRPPRQPLQPVPPLINSICRRAR